MSLRTAITDYLRIAIYESHAKVHWPPRMRQCLGAIRKVYPAMAARGPVRIVDIGAGPGMFFPELKDMQLNYLGIDPDPQAVRLGRSRYGHFPNFEMIQANSTDSSITFSLGDIIVLNGVFHHLQDDEARDLLRKMGSAGAIIILDHNQRSNPALFSPVEQAQHMIQVLDRGKYVRPLEYFKQINTLPLVDLSFFHVYVMKFPLWPHFLAIYQSSKIG